MFEHKTNNRNLFLWFLISFLFLFSMFLFASNLFKSQGTNALIQFDEQLFLQLNQLGNVHWDSFWLFLTTKENWYPFYFASIIFVAYKMDDWKKFVLFFISLILLIVIVDAGIDDLFKPYFHRLRPCYNDSISQQIRLVPKDCGGQLAFFSAHSANSFALVGFLILALKPKKWIALSLLIWACLVAYSRIYVGVHYPLDIIVGAVYGLTWSLIVYLIYNQFLDLFHRPQAVNLPFAH